MKPIHFDAATGNVFDNNGEVIDPKTGAILGKFNAYGLMVPDGKLGLAYFLGLSSDVIGPDSYVIESFDIHRYTPVAVLPLHGIEGQPTHLIRWGTNGLALTTRSSTDGGNYIPGQVYILSGSFVTGTTPNGHLAESTATSGQ